MPLVSVVIPTYNGSAWIAETLDSVFQQTLSQSKTEVIVVDDGSTDDTLEAIAPYRDRLRLIQQENMGVGAARNRGIEAANGRYVAPLDHDDLWKPRKLEVQVDFMETHSECVGCTVPWAVSTSPEEPVFDPSVLCDASNTIPHPIRKHWSSCFWRSSFGLMRREAIEDLQYGTRRDCTEDREFELRLFARGAIGVAGQSVLGIYRSHDSNTSGNLDYSVRGTRRLRALDRSGYFDELNGSQRADLRFFLAQRSRSVLINLLRHGERKKAFRLYVDEAADLLRSHVRLFAVAFPGFLLAPPRWIRWYWPAGGPLHDE